MTSNRYGYWSAKDHVWLRRKCSSPSTLLGVTILGYRNQLVEVEAVAALR